MLDQNTDRMWYVIGALVVGAGIILLANNTMPEVFANVTESFEQPMNSGTKLLHDLAKTTNLYTGGDYRYQGIPGGYGYSIGHIPGSIVAKNIPVKPNTTYEIRYYKEGLASNLTVLTFTNSTTLTVHNHMYSSSDRIEQIGTYKNEPAIMGGDSVKKPVQTDNEIVKRFTTSDNVHFINLTSGNVTPEDTLNAPFDFKFTNIRLYEL